MPEVFDRLAAPFEEQRDRRDDVRTIANVSIQFSFAGDAMRERLLPALIDVGAQRAPEFTLRIWECASPEFPWRAEDLGPRGAIDVATDDSMRAAFTVGSSALSMLDLERGIGLFRARDARELPWYERAAPFRTLLHWILESRGCRFVHAAAVATEDGGALLAGRGGSGKSTTAMLCVRDGFQYAGDDYVGVTIDDEPRAHAIFTSAKLSASSLDWLPFLRAAVRVAPVGDEKGVAMIGDVRPQQIAASFPLRAVIVPRVTGGKSGLHRISGGAALRALAPTTLLQLPGNGAEAFAHLAELVRKLPAWSLDLGDDRDEIPNLVAHAIASGAPASRRLAGRRPGAHSPARRRDAAGPAGEDAGVPLVTVIVPTFNGAATLPAAIDSIRAQNVEVEIIVVDDGSTDDTPRVIASLDVIAIRQDNRGPAAARNAGLALATAPLVAFLDDDDVWLPHKLEQQLATLREQPEAAVTLGYTAFQSLDLTTGAATDVAEPHLLYHLGAALCRRETFDRIGAFDPVLQSSEDVDWFLRVRDAGLGLIVTPDVVQIHRRNGANMTRGKDLRELGFIEVVKRSLDRRRASGAPLVSVIVPLYNGARFLGEALDSIAAQEYSPIEIIVVDNGSTDDGARIAEARGLTLLQCERRGAGAARNAGVDAARGEILMFLDQDDRWLPTKLRRQLEVLAAHPDSICIANQAYFLAPGVTRPKWFARENLLEADHAGWAPSCLAVRRATFDRVGRFDESMLHASDVDWFARAKELGIAVELPPETLVHRRVHEQNDSANLAAMTEFFNVIRAASARRRNNTEPERT